MTFLPSCPGVIQNTGAAHKIVLLDKLKTVDRLDADIVSDSHPILRPLGVLYRRGTARKQKNYS